jgi:hypothetical protein
LKEGNSLPVITISRQMCSGGDDIAETLAGRLGFELIKTFKVYPKLFGYEINDDSAELSFRLFDHPRVYIFKRVGK